MDFFEEETTGRRGRAGCRAIFRREDSGALFRSPLSLANFNESTCQNADHLPEESVPGDPNRPMVGFAQCRQATDVGKGANGTSAADCTQL